MWTGYLAKLCPPGECIVCGAREGDYFTIWAEMMHFEMESEVIVMMNSFHDYYRY